MTSIFTDQDVFVRRVPYREPAEFEVKKPGLTEFLRTYLVILASDPMRSIDITRYIGTE